MIPIMGTGHHLSPEGGGEGRMLVASLTFRKLTSSIITEEFSRNARFWGKDAFILNKEEFVTIVRNISKRLRLSATLPGAFNGSTALWTRLSPLRHRLLTIQLSLHVIGTQSL